MERTGKTLLRNPVIAICCLWAFAAGIAWPQTVSSESSASVDHVSVSAAVDASSPASVDEARAGQGASSSGGAAVVPGGDAFSAGQGGLFSGAQQSFSAAKNDFESLGTVQPHRAFGSLESNQMLSRPETSTSMNGSAVRTSSPGLGTGSIMEARALPTVTPGQFPDSTRELVWPSPLLYQTSDPFPFKPVRFAWNPNFGEQPQLSPSYLVSAIPVSLHAGTNAGRMGSHVRVQMVEPFSQMNTKIKAQLNSGLPKNPLGDALADPLEAGN